MSDRIFSYIETAKYPEQTCIGINKGKYAGVVYKYGTVTPIEENGALTMKFEYDIIENNAIPRDQFGDEFFNLIGDILVEVIDEKFGKDNIKQSNNK
jgi:hypothetical protein|tara:strand:- start:159 stop:449 length:291 start_codon:yes stop_codon:yes gene_type:complete